MLALARLLAGAARRGAGASASAHFCYAKVTAPLTGSYAFVQAGFAAHFCYAKVSAFGELALGQLR